MRGKAQATLLLEQAILDIVEERAPITVRGVCYALFVRELISSMAVGQTQKISRIMTEMRESEALDWTQIVDGNRAVERAKTWGDPNAIIRAAVNQYRRNNWQDQSTIVEVWSREEHRAGRAGPGARRAWRHLPDHEGLRQLHLGHAGGRGLERPCVEP